MRRSLFTIVTVAMLAGLISGAEGVRDGAAGEWIRTVDGWERRSEAFVAPHVTGPTMHPAVVAAFQLGTSVLGLLAFPSRVRIAQPRPKRPLSAASRPRRKRLAAT